jgi:hypothetical protein
LHALMDGVESGLGQLAERMTRMEQQLAVLRADSVRDGNGAAPLEQVPANGSDGRQAAD